MLVYFFAITYGMYLATMLEFILFNNEYFQDIYKHPILDFFKGRSPWAFYDYDIEFETSYRFYHGRPIKI